MYAKCYAMQPQMQQRAQLKTSDAHLTVFGAQKVLSVQEAFGAAHTLSTLTPARALTPPAQSYDAMLHKAMMLML